MSSESKKTVLIAAGANLVIAVSKFVAGAISGSAAILAEGAHSVADTGNQVFLLVSLRMGERAPDEDHPFGYGKERFFWAFVAAIGNYNPKAKPAVIDVNAEQARAWLEKGAMPTDTVRSLLKKAGVLGKRAPAE